MGCGWMCWLLLVLGGRLEWRLVECGSVEWKCGCRWVRERMGGFVDRCGCTFRLVLFCACCLVSVPKTVLKEYLSRIPSFLLSHFVSWSISYCSLIPVPNPSQLASQASDSGLLRVCVWCCLVSVPWRLLRSGIFITFCICQWSNCTVYCDTYVYV